MGTRRISVTVDGVAYSDDVEPRTLLVHYLRERLGKTGTVVGCDTSNCGACTVHLDGRSVKSCSVLAVQADGREVTTIEGLAAERRAAPGAAGVPREPRACSAATARPGMIMQAVDLLKDNPDPDRGGDPRGPRGQPLPLHGLPEHRQGGAGARPTAGSVSRPPCRRRCRMTAVDETAAAEEFGQARRRKEDARLITGRTRWTDNIVLPGMLHLAMVRSPVAHGDDHRRSTPPRPRPCPGVIGGLDRRRPRRRAGRPALRLADHRRTMKAPAATRRSRSTRSTFAGEIVAVVAARSAAEARDAAEQVDVDYDDLPVVLDMKEAVEEGAAARPRRARHQQSARRGSFDSGEAGTGGDVDEAIAAAHATRTASSSSATYRQQRLDPGVHGAALHGRRPDRRAAHGLVGDPGAAHRCGSLLAADRWASPSRRCASSRRTSAAASAASCSLTPEEVVDRPRRAQARQAGQVHRDPQRVDAQSAHHGRDQIQKLTLSRQEGRHGHRSQGRAARRHGRLPRPRHAAACRSSARSCSTRSTSSRRTSSTCDERVHEQDARPTPTAAPAGPRRPSPSSG